MIAQLIDSRYEASFQVYSDMEPYEFYSDDLTKVKDWMAGKLVAFTSPAHALILDHGTDGSPVLFEEVN